MEKLLKKILLYGFFLSFLINSATAFAATIRVPGDYLTIQAGIDAASEGDTVMVADGTYKGIGNKNLLFKGKAITVRSENGPKNCVIDPESNGSGFNFHGFEGKKSVLSGFTITNGYSAHSEGGGGISCNNSSPTITNCVINGNYAFNRGGGISCYYYSSPTITNCVINENDGSTEGGGISIYKYSSPTITNCEINANKGFAGGGIYCGYDSQAKITNCTIKYNEANGGGGIRSNRSNIIINNCTISNNSATGAGGIHLYTTSGTITNSIVVVNTGGGISCYENSSPTITNCTISGNSHYGIWIFGSSPTITNSIFWENDYYEIYIDSGLPTITYCDIQGGYSGEGNIDSNPLFIGGGDYHLTASSPCIDAGTSIGAPTHDIDGDSRPQGITYDIGADEYIIPLIGAIFFASKTRGAAPLMVNFTDQSFGTVDSWNWSFGDGLTSNEQNPSHTYNDSGIYTVSLTVTGPEGSNTMTKIDYIKVGNAMPWIPLLLLDD